MSWQLLTLISVVGFSVSVLLRRILLSKDKSDPFAYVIIFQGLVGLITGAYALHNGFVLPDLSKYWLAILATTVLYAFAHIASANTLKLVEASVFSVLFATSAIWTVIASLFIFSDSITLMQVAGLLLITVSVGILSNQKNKWKLEKGIYLGLLTGFLFGIATVGWVYVGRSADTASWTALSFLGPSLIVLLVKPKSILKMTHYANKKILMRMLLLATVFGFASLASMQAYKIGNINLIVALQQTGIVLTTLIGIIFLKETSSLWRKILSSVICFVAVLLII